MISVAAARAGGKSFMSTPQRLSQKWIARKERNRSGVFGMPRPTCPGSGQYRGDLTVENEAGNAKCIVKIVPSDKKWGSSGHAYGDTRRVSLGCGRSE